MEQDALSIDDSAAAAHYNNIGVTHILLHEMVHASAALDRALAAASVRAPRHNHLHSCYASAMRLRDWIKIAPDMGANVSTRI